MQGGHPASARILGLLLRTLPESAGVNQNEIESIYQLAATMGDVEASCEIAQMHIGRGELDTAETWIRLALARGSDAKRSAVELMMGLLMEARGRPRDQEAWYRRAAEHGLPAAMINLGVALTDRGEYAEAEHWYHKALAAGQLQAEVNLGTLHRRRGKHAEARRWYQRAAQRGDNLAEQALCEMGET